jgi:hypothetical protein
MEEFVRNIRDKQGVKLYIDRHSFGQGMHYPFGHDMFLYAPQLGDWTMGASLMSNEIAANTSTATGYTYPHFATTNYFTIRSAVDHVYALGRAE